MGKCSSCFYFLGRKAWPEVLKIMQHEIGTCTNNSQSTTATSKQNKFKTITVTAMLSAKSTTYLQGKTTDDLSFIGSLSKAGSQFFYCYFF